MKFQFIEAHGSIYSVVQCCRILKVSRSGYYAWKARGRKIVAP